MIWSSEGGIDFVDCVNSVFFKYCWGVHVQAWWKLFDLDRLSKYLWRANICLIIFEIKNDRGSWILVILKNPSFCGFVAATAQFSEGSFSRLQISSGGLCPGDLNCYHRDSKKVMGAPIHAPTSPNVVHLGPEFQNASRSRKKERAEKRRELCRWLHCSEISLITKKCTVYILPKTNMDTQNGCLEKVTPFKHVIFRYLC